MAGVNGGSIPVFTERKATGQCVLECFLSATIIIDGGSGYLYFQVLIFFRLGTSR